MAQPDVYLLTAHEPYTDPRHPVPINSLIVHALTLLHPDVPQPDGGMMYRCLTEFPHRRPGEIVPVSTLTYELAGGDLWPQIGDWEAVTDALVAVSRASRCDAMTLGLPQIPFFLLSMGPYTNNVLHRPDGTTEHRGPEHRQHELDTLAEHLRQFRASGPLWPGDNLVTPPNRPAVLPYQPYRYSHA
ncbi:hypothetical protein [Pseudonocardia sp. GCM10023141]|uniref:hypothetical protein n=1 Tax=Pseudonocardia sp. GCM10023141 TaxID=3252653 RepID=UPI00360F1442